jgi:hypothetical protein
VLYDTHNTTLREFLMNKKVDSNTSPQNINTTDNFKNFHIPFHARITTLLQKTNIQADDIVWYIDAIISVLEDITENSWENTLPLQDQALYLHEVFKEVEVKPGFSTPELKFIWAQINHLIQPFRNIKTAYEGIVYMPNNKEMFQENIEYYVERMHLYKEGIIWKLRTYRELLLHQQYQKIHWDEIVTRFQQTLRQNDVVIETSWNLWDSYSMGKISFQIIFDNLISNYQKYGKEWKLYISISTSGVLEICFENSYKDESETKWVLSSQIWNPLVIGLVQEIFWWNVAIERGEEKYKMHITGLQLSQKRIL